MYQNETFLKFTTSSRIVANQFSRDITIKTKDKTLKKIASRYKASQMHVLLFKSAAYFSSLVLHFHLSNLLSSMQLISVPCYYIFSPQLGIFASFAFPSQKISLCTLILLGLNL